MPARCYEQVKLFATKSGFQTSGARSTQVSSIYRMARIEARLGHAVRATELYADAVAAAWQFMRDFPDVPGVTGILANIHAWRGEKTEALAAMDDATSLNT